MTNDSISKSAAINLVSNVCKHILDCCKSHFDSECGDEVYDNIDEVNAILECNKQIRSGLKNLPQTPEIVRCEHCRYWSKDEIRQAIGYCALWGDCSRQSTDFCSDGRTE